MSEYIRNGKIAEYIYNLYSNKPLKQAGKTKIKLGRNFIVQKYFCTENRKWNIPFETKKVVFVIPKVWHQ